ncbi:ABC transporter ATP-binding protein [Streptomyces sp. NBC_01465]|uniref:ABC transporter ATP-binding protein n=1 Tax=Streptomyces sp. NBC_01465 TaxID=2903878 RepID=UPI002E3309B1|nr:ABC transporter ATP-binding protein [Streptomyces sp. NBC_01465]
MSVSTAASIRAVNRTAPDHRSAPRYLWWLVVSQRRRTVLAAVLGSSWMVGLALPPYLLSRAIDDGLQKEDMRALAGWTAALLAVGLVMAWLSIMRHRTMTRSRLDAQYRTVRAVVRQTVRLGAVLRRRVTAGEVVTIGIRDVQIVANVMTVTGPGVGAVIAYFVIAGLLLSVSALLAVVVLVGVPVLAVLVGPLLGRLQGAESAYREKEGRLSTRFVDMAGGLRVLSGLGGKEVYLTRYRQGSQDLQAEGYKVGAVFSWIQALAVGLPALFLAAVTWLAARMAAEGTISVGQLTAIYGYVAVLVIPVTFFIEGGYDISRGLVAARRIVRFLQMEPAADGGTGTGPTPHSVLHDPASGVEIAPRALTALVSARPAESADVVDRLGRFGDSDVRWGGLRIDAVAQAEVRERIVVADNEAHLFSGPLREVVGGRAERDEEALGLALHAALAEDIVQGLPDGLGSAIDAQGLNLSGGQRQRVRLVRALLADPEVLLAVEPTSAVDAHTEAAVAARLRSARAGRTTVVTTTSPLLLDRAHHVHYLVEGRVAATGSHRELLAAEPGYRALVSRGAEETEDAR